MAQRVFDDPFQIDDIDDSEDYGEERSNVALPPHERRSQLKVAGIMKRKTSKSLLVSSPHKRRTQSKVAGVMKKKNADTATDWNKFDALSEEEVHKAALNDPDAQPLSEEQLAKMRRPSSVKRLRIKLGLSQTEFAERFQIPIGTLRDWEQHRSDPDQAALSYLKVIEVDPEFVARALAA